MYEATGMGTTATLAGIGKRFVGLIIDGLIIGVPISIVLAILGLYGSLLGTGLNFLVGLVYSLWGVGSGQSVGCMAMSIKFVDQDTGMPPGIAKALLRYFMAIVSAFAILLGYLWAIWDSKNQTWHDKVAGTLVVDA